MTLLTIFHYDRTDEKSMGIYAKGKSASINANKTTLLTMCQCTPNTDSLIGSGVKIIIIKYILYINYSPIPWGSCYHDRGNHCAPIIRVVITKS